MLNRSKGYREETTTLKIINSIGDRDSLHKIPFGLRIKIGNRREVIYPGNPKPLVSGLVDIL